jgi:hypothetical protein
MLTKYIPFTEAQKQAAKQTDLAAFLQGRGEKIKRSGSEYEWVGHHITLRGNQFYHHYEQRGGTAVDFVREQYGLNYPEAVQLLLGSDIGVVPITEHLQNERQPFELPSKNDNMRRVYAYLIKQRCIDRAVIYHFAHRGLIYEDAEYHNVVFIGTDKDGTPRHAHKKSTSSNDSSFRANQSGSEAAFSFAHIGESDTVYVFEAPIDMLSYISLHPQSWQEHSYISLCSVSERALFQRLDDNPQLRKIKLCLDNDEAGCLATERISEKLTECRYGVSIHLSQGKDWNDDLKQSKKLSIVPCQLSNGSEGEPSWGVISMS